MAIVLKPKYPIPDRSRQAIRLSKAEDGVIDIGWCDGVLSDGRAFRAEIWAQDGISILSFFFSTLGMEEFDKAALRSFVEKEGLVSFDPLVNTVCSSRPWTDNAGNPMWSVNVVVGNDNGTFITGSVPLFPYSKINEPNSMFNPTPIKVAHRS